MVVIKDHDHMTTLNETHELDGINTSIVHFIL